MVLFLLLLLFYVSRQDCPRWPVGLHVEGGLWVATWAPRPPLGPLDAHALPAQPHFSRFALWVPIFSPPPEPVGCGLGFEALSG